jgi:hypothetical protein
MSPRIGFSSRTLMSSTNPVAGTPPTTHVPLATHAGSAVPWVLLLHKGACSEAVHQAASRCRRMVGVRKVRGGSAGGSSAEAKSEARGGGGSGVCRWWKCGRGRDLPRGCCSCDGFGVGREVVVVAEVDGPSAAVSGRRVAWM